MIKLWLNIPLTMNVHAEQAKPWSWKSKLHWVNKYTYHWQVICQFPSLAGTVQGPGVKLTLEGWQTIDSDSRVSSRVFASSSFGEEKMSRSAVEHLQNLSSTHSTTDYAEQLVATWNQDHCSKVQTFKLVAWGNLFAEPQTFELTKLRSWSSRSNPGRAPLFVPELKKISTDE